MIFNNAQINRDLALLLLRLSSGGLMIYAHGWPKLANYMDRLNTFNDPIGFGSPVALTLAVFAEVVCALMIILGIYTRFAALTLIILTMVIVFVVHIKDPFSKIELPLMYLFAYLTIFLAGAGRYAVKR
ncbi:MAG: DoxX family protein [Cyclobacteriaceae bacterium]